MLRNSSETKGILCIILASVFWGTTGTSASFISDVSPLAIGAFSMGVGGLLLVWNAQNKLRQDYKKLRAHWNVLVTGGLSVAIYPLAFYSSMKLAGVAIGTLISIASAPFFTALLERLISKKVVTIQWVISFVIGAAGITLLTIGKSDHSDLNEIQSMQHWGILLGLVAGLTYALYSWCGRQMIEQGMSSQSSMAGMFGIAALFLLPSLLFTGKNLFADTQHIMITLYMAIIPMFIGYLCFGYGLKHIDASKATLITLLEPAVATVFAVTIVGEKFTALGWYGVGLIIFCLVIQIIKWPKMVRRVVHLNNENSNG